MNRVSILGIEIDDLDLQEAVNRINGYIEKGQPSMVVTANPEMIMLAEADREFRECLQQARMVTADGIGLVIAAKILGTPLRQRVTGIDLVTALFENAENKKHRFYFVGARPGVAEKAAENIRNRYPGVTIAGLHHGYFEDDSHLISDIAEKKPDILLVALGMGRQEKWIKDRVQKTGVPVSIGVGGSFDVLAGEVKRAPVWMRKAGLEWLYRLIKQPSRFIRMLQLPRFLIAVAVSRIFSCRQ